MRTRVEDVMTTDVAAVRVGTRFRTIAELLDTRNVSAVPVVDDTNRVIGVVSEADLLHKEEFKQRYAGEHYRPTLRARLRDGLGPGGATRTKAAATTAGQLMSSPAVTVHASSPVVMAARLMEHHGVKRLPVVDDSGYLVGMVSRCDLLRVFVRRDADLERSVSQEIVALVLADPKAVQVSVRDGVVTLGGRLPGREQAERIVRLTENLDGVIDVIHHLTWSGDPTDQRAHSDGEGRRPLARWYG
jgi:CBS-domain-containing membrane protein